MAKVSLMMPVYKTERFIEKSLRSVLEQTFEDMEVIIVNDATPDSSMVVVENVLKEYPHRKGQVKIISHPVNMGLAAARQTAIDNATGEYTIHVDSDDWVELGMVEHLYACAKEEDADIVVCDYYIDFPNCREYCSQAVTPSTGKELAKAMMKQNLSWAVWNKLIRKSLYDEYDIRWVPGIDRGEDLLITVKLSLFANKVSYLPEAFLHYCQDNPNAYTTIFNQKSLDNLLRCPPELDRFIKEQPDHIDYAEDLIYLKLHYRFALWSHTRGGKRRQFVDLYADIPRRYIFKQPNKKLHDKVANYLASLGCFWVMDLKKSLVKFKQRRGK